MGSLAQGLGGVGLLVASLVAAAQEPVVAQEPATYQERATVHELSAAQGPEGPEAPPAVPDTPLSKGVARLPVIGRWLGGAALADAEAGRSAPHYALEIQAPAAMVGVIREHTLLGRWRQRPDYDPAQWTLLVRRASAEVRELMAAEAWFQAQVMVTELTHGVRIEVEPGPRTVVDTVDLRFEGAIVAPEHVAALERIQKSWRLVAGAPFRSADWERAKRDLLVELHDHGFLHAALEASEALVDESRARAVLQLRVASGERLSFGSTVIEGLTRYPPEVVRGLQTYRTGDPFDPRRLMDYQTRLIGGGWFTTVNVHVDRQALDRDPALSVVPVRVDLVERQAKRWSLGGGYDTDRGFNVLTAWDHRNVAGLGVQTLNGVELDWDRQLAYSTWETPQEMTGRRWQFGTRLEHRDIRNDLVDAGSIFGSRLRRRGTIETATSLQGQAERQSIVFAPDQETETVQRAWVLGWTWTQRQLDSPLFPTQGYVLSVQGSAASSALGATQTFARGYVFGYGLLPMRGPSGASWGRWVVRGELGAVWASDREGIPSVNLFRTGGAKSIRGYGAQSLGVSVGQATVGGRYLAVGSIEYQWPLSPEVALAAFYDVGNAADSRHALAPVVGWGVGGRWRTPVGPLNLDVARGQAVQEWRLHVSIGVVF